MIDNLLGAVVGTQIGPRYLRGARGIIKSQTPRRRPNCGKSRFWGAVLRVVSHRRGCLTPPTRIRAPPPRVHGKAIRLIRYSTGERSSEWVTPSQSIGKENFTHTEWCRCMRDGLICPCAVPRRQGLGILFP